MAELAVALEHEARLIDDLAAALRDQRAAVASDDAFAVDASVRTVSRALLTLGEARRQRLAALTDLGEEPLAARERLRSAAAAAAREIAINQAVLSRALVAGEAFLQQLFSGGVDTAPVYEPAPRRSDGAHAAVLLDRTA